VTKEWVKKTSSRIWRGSLAKHVWKYLSKGAWAPKKNPKHGRQRRSGYAQKHAAQKQKAQGGPTVRHATAQIDVMVQTSLYMSERIIRRPSPWFKKSASGPVQGRM
jgi:hypothetical protein